MSDNVVILPVVTRLDLPPERILKAALDEGMSEVIVIGYDKDDCEYFASSVSNGGDVLWHLERAKLRILSGGDE